LWEFWVVGDSPNPACLDWPVAAQPPQHAAKKKIRIWQRPLLVAISSIAFTGAGYLRN